MLQITIRIWRITSEMNRENVVYSARTSEYKRNHPISLLIFIGISLGMCLVVYRMYTLDHVLSLPLTGIFLFFTIHELTQSIRAVSNARKYGGTDEYTRMYKMEYKESSEEVAKELDSSKAEKVVKTHNYGSTMVTVRKYDKFYLFGWWKKSFATVEVEGEPMGDVIWFHYVWGLKRGV